MSAHRSLKADLSDLKLGQRLIYEGILDLRSKLDDLAIVPSGTDPDVLEMVRLPVHVGKWIQSGIANGADGSTMLRWISDPARVKANLILLTLIHRRG